MAGGRHNAIGISVFGNEYLTLADLRQFMTAYRTDAEAAAFTVVQLNGDGNDVSYSGSEANVDTSTSRSWPIRPKILFQHKWRFAVVNH